MKLDAFKKLIKEAVREVLREELADMITEAPVKPVSRVTKYENYKPITAKPVPTGDPIMDLLNETRATMTSGQTPGYKPDMSHFVQAPGLGMESMMEDHFIGPEVGIDLSKLDFVGKAASVYKASVEKDKQRFGA
jgi:hypothetical protein